MVKYGGHSDLATVFFNRLGGFFIRNLWPILRVRPNAEKYMRREDGFG